MLPFWQYIQITARSVSTLIGCNPSRYHLVTLASNWIEGLFRPILSSPLTVAFRLKSRHLSAARFFRIAVRPSHGLDKVSFLKTRPPRPYWLYKTQFKRRLISSCGKIQPLGRSKYSSYQVKTPAHTVLKSDQKPDTAVRLTSIT